MITLIKSDNFCDDFKEEIDKKNIGYKISLGFEDAFKSGVSDLRGCFT